MLTRSLRVLLDLETVTVPSEGLVRWIVDRHQDGADLADMMHLIAARVTDAFLGFERRLAALAGPDTPVPVERVR